MITGHLRLLSAELYTCDPPCHHSPPTSEHAFVCVCVCVPVCFTYHLTGSWHPRNKGIVSETASEGRGGG